MSLILEALRKSEAERQRGRAPGLFVEQVATRPAARARMPVWAWALGALLVATLALLAWREWRGDAQRERGQVQFPPAESANAALPSGEAVAVAPGANGYVPATAAPIPETTSGTAPAGASDPSPGGATSRTAGTAATSDFAAAPSPRAALPAGAATTRTSALNPNSPQTVPSASPSAAPAELPASLTAAEAMIPPAGPAAAPPEVNLPPFSPPSDPLPTLASLDAATRAQLPPLKLSMHVYADEPAQRFVILDGQRLGEGASPRAGLVLEEIRREGLVLSVNGQRLLLARP